MAMRRSRPFMLILLLILVGLVACDRSLPGMDQGDLPTPIPTAVFGGATGDPDVGGGRSEAADPAYPDPAPAPTEMAETIPRETAEPDREDDQTVEDVEETEEIQEVEEIEETIETDESEEAGETVEEEVGEADEDAGGGVPAEEIAPTDTPAVIDEEAAAGSVAAIAEIPRTHTVAAGENLYRIGLQYGISWVAIARANGLTNPNRITVGQQLTIPGNGEPGTGGQPTPSPQTETTYVVRPGDNLFRIGLAYGISWIQIAEANGLMSPGQIYTGQVLKIPVSRPGPTPQFTHQVRPGETLFRIALHYGIPWTTIAQANNLSSPYVIYTGQPLIIPGQQ